jgi:Tol biopolymer transport system component
MRRRSWLSASHLTEIRYQLLAALGLAVLLLVACAGGADPAPPASTPDETPGAVATAPLEAGDTRFLLARRNAIDNITLSGQSVRLVTLDDNVNILDMSMSADGNQLAFVVELPAYTNDDGELDFGADLYVSNVDGGNARLVAKHEGVGTYFEAPAWLNSTTLLVGTRGFDDLTGSFSRIERVDLTTGAREVVLEDAAMGTLSPDRAAIVYTSLDPQTRVQRLVIEDLASSDTPRVLVDEFDGLALFSAVVFSPDASQLAFAAVDLLDTAPPAQPPPASGASRGVSRAFATTHPFAQDVWLVDPADGAGLHRIADIAENMPSVSWSGDGNQLYVLGPGFLWRLDPATGEAEMLRESGERGSIIWLEGE